MQNASVNPLISQQKTSDSKLNLQLHPLVILSISDYITRHTIRQQKGAIVGAILGQQHGRDITLEHAFECKVIPGANGDTLLDTEWFQDRLQQYKDVHKAPALEFVGWFTLAPPSGPEPYHLPLHRQFLTFYNESSVLLTFHPSIVFEGASSGGKLPLTIYESVYEAAPEDGDDPMHEPGAAPVLRFKELAYTVDTGQAEMIGVDFVARGGANAALANGTATKPSAATKGKTRASQQRDAAPEDDPTDTSYLTAEDEEMIASLTAKSNAIKMLHQRLALIKAYLASLPPSYLTAADAPTAPAATDPQTSHTILRAAQALLARLPLLIPSDAAAFARETRQEQLDALLVVMLGALGGTLKEAGELGVKWGAVAGAREVKGRMGALGKGYGDEEDEEMV